MRVLVATVGTTHEPIVESVKTNDVDLVYLVHGRPFPGQHPSPLDVARRVLDYAGAMEKKVVRLEVEDPEDVSLCVEAFKKLVKELADMKAGEVIVNFTGGTKPLSAAAFHVFATRAPFKVVFEYVGGAVRDDRGRVSGRMVVKKDYKTAVEEVADRVVAYVESYQFYLALERSKELPDTYTFLKKACTALWLWDSFEHEEAVKIINEIGSEAEALLPLQALGRIPENVVKLRSIGNRLVKALKALKDCQNRGAELSTEDGHLAPLEFLANAERRLKTRQYAEAVLRAYRAVEAAVQLRLLENKVNPWNVNWQQIPNSREVLRKLECEENPPEHLTLWKGLQLLNIINPISQIDEVVKNLQFVSNLRNNSKLEHGYASVDEENAKKAVEKAMEIVRMLLGEERAQEIEKIRIFT
ncbi:MAG: TIGR02710 family CRISPR-associated CARF protein [Candidatus Jordarchaeales archaeon]